MKYFILLLASVSLTLGQTSLINPKVNKTTGAIVGVTSELFRTGNDIQTQSDTLDFLTNATAALGDGTLDINVELTIDTLIGTIVRSEEFHLSMGGRYLFDPGVDAEIKATGVDNFGLFSTGNLQLAVLNSGIHIYQDLTVDGTTTANTVIASGTIIGNNFEVNADLFINGYPISSVIVWTYALSDEVTDLTTGTKVTFRCPHNVLVQGARLTLNTASSSGLPTVQINHSASPVFSTLVSVDVSEKTSQTAVTTAVVGDAQIDDDEEVTLEVTIAGTGAKGAKLHMYVVRPP